VVGTGVDPVTSRFSGRIVTPSSMTCHTSDNHAKILIKERDVMARSVHHVGWSVLRACVGTRWAR
jgi:hypothetical protein